MSNRKAHESKSPLCHPERLPERTSRGIPPLATSVVSVGMTDYGSIVRGFEFTGKRHML